MDWFPGRAAMIAVALALVTGVTLLMDDVSTKGVVAADHALASRAGAEILAAGGNAVDAAVATALAAGVVQPAGSGLGGGGFAVVLEPGGVSHVLDFREVAPRGATREMFLDETAVPVAGRSRMGGLAVAVPGEPQGLVELERRFGRLSLSDVAEPAIRLAEEGFPAGEHLGDALQQRAYQQVRALFTSDGVLATEGVVVRRPDLARALRAWAREDTSGLSGADARVAVARAVASAGGVLTEDDLRAYRVRDRDPVIAHYKAYTLVTMPPPSSGGIVLAQMLGVLAQVDLASLGHNSPEYVHRLAQTMAHAYADRAHHLGDPDFVAIPSQRLLSAERRDAILGAFDPTRTLPPDAYGPRIAPPLDGGTQHISVMDESGWSVALTTTINTSFGSGVVVPEFGLILNNEMDDFAAAPGVPNAFGLVGGEANAVAPGKRPLSSMTPTLVLDEHGAVVMSIGASGGSFIISSVLQVFLNLVEFHMSPEQAVASPRVHEQWLPDVLFVEPGLDGAVLERLRQEGYTLEVAPGYSACQVVMRTPAGLVGASDPRKGGAPASSP